MPPIFPRTAVYYASLPVTDDRDVQRMAWIVEETPWTVDTEATVRAEGGVQIVRREVELGPEISEVDLEEVFGELGGWPADRKHREHREIQFDVGDLRMITSPTPGEIEKLTQVASTPFRVFVPGISSEVSAGSPPEGGSPPGPDGNGPKPKEPAKGEEPKGKADGKAPLGDPSNIPAVIAAAMPAFGDPAALWKYVGTEDTDDLAKGILSDLYRDRSDFAKKAEWLVAPELTLLERCPEGYRGQLAKELLEVKGELSASGRVKRMAQADFELQRTALAVQEVELAKQRVALAGKGVDLAGETYEHMRKWRKIANWGLGALVATTLFSMVAVGYMLFELVHGGEVSDVAAPIIIFVLALFAISPAVLLLRERPLEGLDKWFPGKSGDAEEKKEKDDKKAEGDEGSATSESAE